MSAITVRHIGWTALAVGALMCVVAWPYDKMATIGWAGFGLGLAGAAVIILDGLFGKD